MALRIEKEINGKILEISVAGDFDLHSSRKLENIAVKHLEDQTVQGIIINLREVRILDSTGIGSLIVISRKCSDTKALRLCCLPDRIEKLFKSLALTKLLAIDPTESSARKNLTELLK